MHWLSRDGKTSSLRPQIRLMNRATIRPSSCQAGRGRKHPPPGTGLCEQGDEHERLVVAILFGLHFTVSPTAPRSPYVVIYR